MQEEKTTYEGICVRLVMLVDECSGGNAKKFAENAGINTKTFQTNISGRMPNVETLGCICRFYDVSLNWLIAGIGSPYRTPKEKIQPNSINQETSGLIARVTRLLTCKNQDTIEDLAHKIYSLERAIEKEQKQQAENEAIRKELAELKKQKCEDGKHCPGELSQDEKAA